MSRMLIALSFLSLAVISAPAHAAPLSDASALDSAADGAARPGTVRVGALTGALVDDGAVGTAGAAAEVFFSPRWSAAAQMGWGLGADQRHLAVGTLRRGFGRRGGLYAGLGAGHRLHSGVRSASVSSISVDLDDPMRDPSQPVFSTTTETHRFQERGAVGVLEAGARWQRQSWTLGVGAVAAQPLDRSGGLVTQGVVSVSRDWSPRRTAPGVASR